MIFVVEQIKKYHKQGDRYEDHACLFRTRKEIDQYAVYLSSKDIPFYTTESIRNIFDHFIAIDFITYLECADGYIENLFSIINKPKRYVEKRYIKRKLDLDALMQIYATKDLCC